MSKPFIWQIYQILLQFQTRNKISSIKNQLIMRKIAFLAAVAATLCTVVNAPSLSSIKTLTQLRAVTTRLSDNTEQLGAFRREPGCVLRLFYRLVHY